MSRRGMDVAKFNRLREILKKYSDSRTLEHFEYGDGIHQRLTDSFTCIDIWPSTGKYWVKETNYYKQLEGTGLSLVEKGGQKGYVSSDKNKAFNLLDGIFYATELMEVE